MNLRPRLVGLTATLLILNIIIALPATLLSLGASPIPTHLPSLEQLRSTLTSPDDGTLALAAINVIAWTAWAFLTGSLAVEVGARLAGITTPHLPGLAIPQTAARNLITAAALLFITTPLTTSPATAAPANDSTAAAPDARPTQAISQDGAVRDRPAPRNLDRADAVDTHTVKQGENLWSIATARLGTGQLYRDIITVNPELRQHPNVLTPGTVLNLPTASSGARHRQHDVRVHRGDTLSGIAHRELGNADRYPQIFKASTNIRQPDGRHLKDPDLIDIGWTLTIPSAPTIDKPPSPATVNPAPAPPAPGAAPASPAPAPPAPSSPPQTTPVTPSTPVTPRTPASASATVTVPTPTAADLAVTPSAQAPTQQESTPLADTQASQITAAPWVLAGLTGGGVVLAGSMLLVLRGRRQAQFRARRPGRSITATSPVLAPVEKTVLGVGSTSSSTVEFVDEALRRLATQCTSTGQGLPSVAAIELRTEVMILHLSQAAALPRPWTELGDQLRWGIPLSTDLTAVGPHESDQPAPYPLLVTIGAGDDGAVWLLNLEDLALTITGDPTYSQDLARYIAAEIAVNPWSSAVRLDCVGIAAEIAPLNPGRVTIHTTDDIDGIAADLFADAVNVVDRSVDLDLTVATARAGQAGEDSWGARMLLTTATTFDTPALRQLVDLVHQHTGHTGTAVLINGPGNVSCGVQLHVNEHGRLTLPSAGLDLIAVGLTSDEAQGCAALIAQTGDNPPDVHTPIDRSATDGWQSLADQAGGLRPEHTLPRDTESDEVDEPPASLLDDEDDAYLAGGATTSEDLQALAPNVPVSVRARVEEADPTLDEDVQLWFDPDCPLPRLSLIGPVTARTRGTPVTSRTPYWTEILAYLATRPYGATPDELAAAFTITPTKAREYARTVRGWLGLNPRTGQRHLPNAREAPSAKLRGVGVYEVADVLVDMHLFFRLRIRGETKGPAGIDDLRTALHLVGGRPFDQLRAQGWTWLLDGDRLDHHLVCAIVDVAHCVITHDLHAGNLRGAQLAAETAILAAPDDEIARLGLASVAKAAGHHNQAERIVQDQICNRTDDDQPPPELPPRTQQILATNNWLTPS